MPVTYRYDAEEELLVLTAIHSATLEEYGANVNAMIVDSTLPVSSPVLVDVSAVSSVLQANEIRWLRQLLEMLIAHFHSRVAFFVLGTELVTPYFLLATQDSSLSGNVRVFLSRSEAIEWLKGNNHSTEPENRFG